MTTPSNEVPPTETVHSFPVPPEPEMPAPEVRATRKVLFTLNQLERESPVREPFVFAADDAGERVYSFMDPEDADYQDLLVGQENPRLMLYAVLPEDQREIWFQEKVELWQLKALMKRYSQHFGLGTPGESDGSAPS